MNSRRAVFGLTCLVCAAGGVSCGSGTEAAVRLPSIDVDVVSGNGQAGAYPAALSEPVAFRVTAPSTGPIPDCTVSFRVLSGDGKVSPVTGSTDSDGLVETTWIPGLEGDQIISAEARDDEGILASSYAVANSVAALDARWVTGSVFYRNFTDPAEHDGWIVESNDFLIFSSGTPRDARVLFAKIAEDHIVDIMRRLGVSSAEEMAILDGNRETKIKVFAGTDLSATGAWRGLRNSGLEFPLDPTIRWPPTWHRRGLKHEIMHLVEFRLIGPDAFVVAAVPAWFAEGIAEHFADHQEDWACWPLDTSTQLEAWIGTHENPLKIAEVGDIDGTAEVICSYYAMFGLVSDYLLDPAGMGRTGDDIRRMYGQVRATGDFPGAFAAHMGIGIDELRDSLYDRLRAYVRP